MNKVVAIDGPAGSGKGTLAQILSERCQLVNIDTGATYRCVALACLQKKIDLEETDKIIDLSKTIDITFGLEGQVYLNGEDVTDAIRSKEVTNIVSPISSIVEVRENMVALQRKLAGTNDVVMEGRDITTVVLPHANYKFYLDASLDERVKRRVKQNKEKNIDMSEEEVRQNIEARDYNDSHKKVGSLMRTEDQIYIDSTNMTIEEVANTVINIIKER